MSNYQVSFIRRLSEDGPVLQEKGLPVTTKFLLAQLAEEFAPGIVDDVALTVGSILIKGNDDDSYTVDGFFEFPQADIDLSQDGAWSKCLAHLHEFRDYLNHFYDEGVAGNFEIESVQIGRRTFPVSEIVEKAKAERLDSGRDLIALTAEEVFDRTKRQNGDIALIASGEFEADGLHSNNTAYAVGRVSEDGLFLPIRSHIRFGEATSLFDRITRQEARPAL
jgi:hypothetical protein